MRYLIFNNYFFYQCRSGKKHVIKNRTNQTIDSLIVSNGFDQIKFEKILPSQSKIGYLSFKQARKVHKSGWEGVYSLFVWGEKLKNENLKRRIDFWILHKQNSFTFKVRDNC